jgi:hypothetical protein
VQFAARDAAVWPVCIRAGALADGVPARDLLVSPLHALYLDGCLIPAHLLINGTSILQTEPTDDIVYFHVELETHEVIFAEAAPSETYIDFDNRTMFQNAAEYARIYPDAEHKPAVDCALRLDGGVVVEAVFQRLAARADACWEGGLRPHGIVLSGAGCTRATVPAGVTELHLLSPSVSPPGDRRRLGALITGIRFDGETLDLAAPCCRSGFHRPEQHGSRSVRWTNGAGVIVVSPKTTARAIEVEVYVMMAEERAA